LAVDLLRPELERWGYWSNLSAAQSLVKRLDQAYWKESFYNSWLHSLTLLNRGFEDDEFVPSALRTRSWQLKQLQTQLASWAELRRDTMLYVAQTYSPPGCEYPTAYVEPYPEFYANLRQLMQRTAKHQREFKNQDLGNGIRGFNAAMDRQLDFLEEAARHLEMLESIARKELMREPLSPQDATFLEQTISRQGNMLFGSAAVNGVDFDGWYTKLIYKFKGDDFYGKKQEEFHPVIADVHSSPSDRKVLQVGTGRTDLCVLVVDQGDDCGCVYVGPAYSYYEFVQPIQDRLTGAQWREMLNDSLVEFRRPAWIDPVLTSGAAPHREIGETAVARDGKHWIVTHPGGRWGGHARSKVEVNDEGIERLAKLAPHVRRWNLSNSPVTDQGLNVLAALSDLKAINLQGTSITDAGVNSLTPFRYLRVLNVGDTNVTSASLSTIAKWTYLGRLELANTELDDADLQKLRTLKYLRHLDLRGTRVTREGIEELTAQIPQLEVLWDEQ
jgi:hypothetical protein